MADTTSTQTYFGYKTPFAGERQVALADKLTVEYYRLHYPLLTYRALSETGTMEDDFYHDSKRADRVYKDYDLHMATVLNPEEMGLTAFGIDTTRQVVFYAAMGAFEILGLIPKPGDLVVFDGQGYEVAIIRRKLDSQVAKTNHFRELEFIANIPSPDL
jgi:hypothetical protein